MAIAINLAYLLASVLFIFGLKRLQRVPTARQGNLLAAVAMLIAVVATLVELGQVDPQYILIGLALGGAIGASAALRVKMTAMPQLVALFNGMGGGASALVSLSVVWRQVIARQAEGSEQTMAALLQADVATSIVLSVLIGALTFSGSLVAFAKLQELLRGQPLLFAGQRLLNGLLGLGALGVGVYGAFVATGELPLSLGIGGLTLLALVLGVLLVIPIGGADMPVVISLLNSYSGLAAAMTGFVLQNNLLVIGGSLVGAAGLILTQIMCKAMNRSLAGVLFGGFGAEAESAAGERQGYSGVKSATPEEVALILDGAGTLVIVPGYGLAVAQAQHAARGLAERLQQRGVKVRYAIHPVAGRMPGHMNVLLAEANVPYEQLVEMEQINPELQATDVVLVLGANDVVNPAALRNPQSPIYGMPIIKAHEARTVLIVKRSLSPGFAGIKNPLFEAENSLMVFGDAKQVLLETAEAFDNL